MPKSPEISSLMKYGDIPVSEYTGTPNISIPIYTVKSGILSLPIELSYHGSGIKVNQEATWVGLGWDLNVGGTISYIPVNKNDQNTIPCYLLPWNARDTIINYLKNGLSEHVNDGLVIKHEDIKFKYDSVLYEGSLLMKSFYEHFWTLQQFSGATPASVMELLFFDTNTTCDMFNVNLPTCSFKFYFHPKDNSIVFVGKKNKCKVEFDSSHNTFQVTDESGIKYLFETTEKDYNNQDQVTINAWYLTCIISPDGHTITLHYSNFGRVYPIPGITEKMTSDLPVPYTYEKIKRYINDNNHQTFNQYLSQVETDNELVCFDLSNRGDLRGGAKKLSEIRIVDKASKREIKKYRFDYNYQTSSNVGGDYGNDGTYSQLGLTDSITNCRLSLNKLTQYDQLNQKGEEYLFNYDSLRLPKKTSFAIDYWGYYNGQENVSNLIPVNASHTLIPDALSLKITPINSYYDMLPNDLKEYNGANRWSSITNMTASMLKSITYPTGGRTEFEFEPHSFTNQPYISAETRNKLYDSMNLNVFYNNNTAAQSSIKFTLKTGTKVHFKGAVNGNVGSQTLFYNQLAGSGLTIVNLDNGKSQGYVMNSVEDANSFDQNNHIKTWNEDINLDAGNYLFVCNIPSAITNNYYGYSNIISGSLNYLVYNDSIMHNAVFIGGGVRIKKLKNYDINNTLISTKTYSYLGGKIMTPFQMIERRNKFGLGQGSVITYTITSDAANAFANAYYGTSVGYDKVEITSVDKNGANNGKELIAFTNDEGVQVFSGYSVFDYNYSNGDIQRKTVLNAVSDTIRLETLTYEKSDLSNEVLNFQYERNFLYPYPESFQFGSVGQYTFIPYRTTAYWNYLKTRKINDYLSGGKVTKTTEYTYNSNNYCISEQKETNSDNSVRYNRFTYPTDYTLPPYDLMQLSNMINPVIEKSEYVGTSTTPTYSIKTNYGNFGSNVLGYSLLKPSVIQAKTGANSYENRVYFNKYDSIGNPLYLSKDSATKIVYLWSYNKTYLVAKIEGLTYDEVRSLVGDNIINNLAQKTMPSRSDIEQVRASISASGKTAFVSTYSHYPLIGEATVTNPQGVTTNYTYDTFNRLYLTRNDEKNIVAQYRYAYQNNPDNGKGGYTTISASLTPGASSYTRGSTGSATVVASGGSGSYSYNWSLLSGSSILATGSNGSSFSFTCSQTGTISIKCVITDNTTGLSTIASQTITCNGIVVPSGNFTFQTGYNNAYNTLSSDGNTVSFVLSFYISSITMNAGANYYVASVCEGCQPSVARTLTFTTGGRTWNITFNPDKTVYCQITSGSALTVGGVGFSGSYSL